MALPVAAVMSPGRAGEAVLGDDLVGRVQAGGRIDGGHGRGREGGDEASKRTAAGHGVQARQPLTGGCTAPIYLG